MNMITTTFTWPSGAEKTPPLKLTMSRSALEERDPDGTSLVSAKMRFVGQTEFEMDASGPGEDEYMTPELIRFVWAYMADGSLDVTPGLEGDDAERALEFFGFNDEQVTIPDADPRCVGKRIAYSMHCQTMAKAPAFVALVKKCLLEPGVGAAGVHFLVDGTKTHMNQYGEHHDLPMESYKNTTGATLKRVEITHVAFGERVTSKLAETLLGGFDKTCVALRANVLAQVETLGGVKAEWTSSYLNLVDVGEYGNHEYRGGTRWALQVSLDRSDQKDGIKRMKRE